MAISPPSNPQSAAKLAGELYLDTMERRKSSVQWCQHTPQRLYPQSSPLHKPNLKSAITRQPL
eukprot:CAMPEP_0116028946 /NCGR_PEP_ID=MMETSP0321-20121206/15785_1 /TAXON_ID=163516 /ORGANISM="Leptocylindrus danicus var. danicus, Strain B650" /LENGTH=62 /DNA_ID=CAMNT_0003503105 /DNA_START=9 /DNA_END=197 /DNA_ORIENTATION=-